MTLEIERCQRLCNVLAREGGLFWSSKTAAVLQTPWKWDWKPNDPRKGNLEAPAVTIQGECLSGLADRKAFFFPTQSNYAFIALSPQIKESTLWTPDTHRGCSSYYYLQHEPVIAFKFPLNTATGLAAIRLKTGRRFHLGAHFPPKWQSYQGLLGGLASSH